MSTTVLDEHSSNATATHAEASNHHSKTVDDTQLDIRATQDGTVVTCDVETDQTPRTQSVSPKLRIDSSRNSEPLADLVDGYPLSLDAAETRWLKRLQLTEPRRNIHCLGRTTRVVKRLVDLVVASCMLILLLPLMIVVGVLIRLTSPGAALFCQTRVGLNQRNPSDRRRGPSRPHLAPAGVDRRHPDRDRRRTKTFGREFTLYKFRTMRNDAEKNGAQFAQENDPRVTTIGKVLRKTRIDELPQLWNVIKGDMSLVGPRPERPEFIAELSAEIPDYLQRLGLRPGLTGVAQVVNGYDNDIEGFRRKVAFDLLYLQNCCLLNDLKILLRTVGVVLTGKGAL